MQAPSVSVRLDFEGRYVETRQEDFAPAEGSIQFRNKMFEVRRTARGGSTRQEGAEIRHQHSAEGTNDSERQTRGGCKETKIAIPLR